MIESTIISNTHHFKLIKNQWNELLEKSQTDKLFMRWEWLFNWWIVFGDNYQLFIILVHENNNLIAIAPLYVNILKFTNLFQVKLFEILGSRFVGSDYLDFIFETAKEEVALKEITDVLEKRRSNILHLVNIREDSAAYKIVDQLQKESGFRVYSYFKTPCPYIELPNAWDELLMQFKKKKRSNLRYYKRKAEKDLLVKFSRVENEKELNSYFNTLIELNRSRMQQKRIDNLEGTFFNDRFLEFHKRISSVFLDEDILRLYYLKDQENNIIAIKYNFRLNNKAYSYQVGLKLGYEKSRLGTVMLCYCIEDAIKEGCKEYDFLEGNEKYKYEWTKEETIISSYYIYKNNFFYNVVFSLLKILTKLKSRFNSIIL
ncbi:MAG: GNAT family N-acetyltransferase [Thermotogota bacterium]|nr:GNAT family N-acetyltransferase [Thermotogota bacterium]